MVLITDSREQRPYEFDIPTEVGTLPVGDYSIHGFEDHIAIERKTVADLIGCLTTGRERFERELYRGRALDYFALVVEVSLSDLANGRYRSQMLPKSAVQSLVAFSIRYRLPVWFARIACLTRTHRTRLMRLSLMHCLQPAHTPGRRDQTVQWKG